MILDDTTYKVVYLSHQVWSRSTITLYDLSPQSLGVAWIHSLKDGKLDSAPWKEACHSSMTLKVVIHHVLYSLGGSILDYVA